MTREQISAIWLARWRGWRSSGLKISEYARREGFNAHSAYRWRRLARRSGRWSDETSEPRKAITIAKPPSTAKFARVAVSDAPTDQRSMLLRVTLTNGRRAELEIGGVSHLGEVLDVLEQRV
jgi:transposase-like protein